MITVIKTVVSKIRSSELLERIATGAFWSAAGSAVAKILVLIASILTANLLGKNGYGELGLIRSTVNMLVIFGTAGMGVTATKFISQNRFSDRAEVAKTYSVTTLFTTVTAIIIALLVFCFSKELAAFINAANLDVSIKFAALLLFVTILNSAYHGTLAGYEDFKRLSINTFISSFVEAILVVLGAYFWDVKGALLGYGIGVLSLTLLNKYYSRRILCKEGIIVNYRHLRIKDFRVLIDFSLPAALSSFLVVPSYWLVRTLIVRYTGFDELGIYEASDQWRIIILFIPSALSNVVLPILSSYVGQNKVDSFRKALRINLLLNVGVSLILAIIVSVFSSIIMRFYGDGFDNTYTLILLSASTVFSSFASVVGLSIVSRGKTWIGLAFNVLWAFMFIGLSYITLRLGYGASGVAFSLLVAYFFHGAFQFLYLKLSVLK